MTGMHWNYRLLSDREWSGRNAVALSAGVNGIYLSRTNLDVAFDDSDRQINNKKQHVTRRRLNVCDTTRDYPDLVVKLHPIMLPYLSVQPAD